MVGKTPLYVAMHEAGHVVAMLANESPRQVGYVSANGQEGFAAAHARFQRAYGHHQLDPVENPQLAHAAWLDVLETFAGPIAEWRFRGLSTVARELQAGQVAALIANPDAPLKDGEDADAIRVRLAWRDPANIQAEFVRAYNETEALLKPHWNAVDDLGRWLHRVKRIEGEELVEWWCRARELE